MVDFLEIAFFVWTGSIFASQAVVMSTSVYYKRIGGTPELLYLVTCVLSAIPFVLCFLAKPRGLSWSFEWGISFPLVCIHSLGIYAVAWFPIATLRTAEDFKYRTRYLTICLTFALLPLLLTLLGTVVYNNCRAAKLRWCQRSGRPATNIQFQALYRPSVPTSDAHNPFGPHPFYTLCFTSQPPLPPRQFDEEAQEPLTAHSPSQNYPQNNVRPSRGVSNLTIRTDTAFPRATYLILSPSETGPSKIGSLGRGRNTKMKSLGGSIKGEADRRFVAESSPKKHVRIGRGRDLA